MNYLIDSSRQSANQALVSIITINYNQAETTYQFLESAKQLTYPNIEIILVDNASTQSLSTFVDQQHYPNMQLVRSEINLGFTGGNNLGMNVAKGEFFLIINNDTELPSDLIEKLLQPFEENEIIGVTCPKIKFYSHPHIIQYAGYGPMNMYTGTALPVGCNQTDNGRYDQPSLTHFAHGCAMMVHRKVVDQVGRFAESFFLYYEELDWSQRIKDAGYRIYYQASAVVLHKESISVGKHNPLKTYYMARNRILYMRRHCSPFQRLVFYLFFASCIFPKHILSYLATGRFKYAKAFTKGVLWNFISASTSPV